MPSYAPKKMEDGDGRYSRLQSSLMEEDELGAGRSGGGMEMRGLDDEEVMYF